MRILLVSANRTSVNMPVFPLGLAYLGSSLREAGHDVAIFDLLGLEDPGPAVAGRIRAFRPDLIGVSIRNIDNQDPFQPEFYLPEIREIIRACRKVSHAPVVLGGAGYSIFPRRVLRYLGGDYGVAGEGERALCEIAQRIARGDAVDDIPGVITPDQREPVARSLIRDLGRIPRPAHELLPIGRYARTSPMPIQGKRGCNRKCIYCSSPLIEGRTVRLRPPGRIVEEIECAVTRHGVRRFFFVDNLFNYAEEPTLALCQAMISRGLPIEWSCILHPHGVTAELVRRMKKAGCTEASLGFESGSDTMLQRLGKEFTAEDVKQASRHLKAHGISQTGFLLLGGPGESRETVEESLAFAEDLAPEAMKLAVGIRIYPGTVLADIARDEARIPPDADLLAPIFYISEQVDGWLQERIPKEASAHPGWRL